jgi:hypothetical protein
VLEEEENYEVIFGEEEEIDQEAIMEETLKINSFSKKPNNNGGGWYIC